jgi:hypothetical protein
MTIFASATSASSVGRGQRIERLSEQQHSSAALVRDIERSDD